MDFSSKPSFSEHCCECKNNKKLFRKVQKKFKELFIDFNILSLSLENNDSDEDNCYDESSDSK